MLRIGGGLGDIFAITSNQNMWKFTLNFDFVEYSTRLVSFKYGRVLNRDSELYLIEYSTKAISFEYGWVLNTVSELGLVEYSTDVSYKYKGRVLYRA